MKKRIKNEIFKSTKFVDIIIYGHLLILMCCSIFIQCDNEDVFASTSDIQELFIQEQRFSGKK